jgi:hypothetical protein
VRKFEAFSKFFGGMVNNIESKIVKLTQVLGVSLSLEPVGAHLAESYQHVVRDSNLNNYLNMDVPLALCNNEFIAYQKEESELNDYIKALEPPPPPKRESALRSFATIKK